MNSSFNESLNMIAGPGGGVAPQPVAGASAPSLAASLPMYLNPVTAGVGVLGQGLGTFLAIKQKEKDDRERKRIADAELALRKRSQDLEERKYNDGTGQRAMNLSNSAFPAINANMDWRERIGVLARGS